MIVDYSLRITSLLGLVAGIIHCAEIEPKAVRAEVADEKPWYFAQALYPYEPVYFLIDPLTSVAKFQISLSFRLIGAERKTPSGSDRPNGLYAAYSQTSFWDLGADSKPFLDSSYRPELWWHQTGLPAALLHAYGSDLDAGFGHESNGKSGSETRSLNIAFVRPTVRWDFGEAWRLRIRPKIYAYVGDLTENPDIPEYRGHVDLEGDLGTPDGWLFATRARVGSHFQHGSIQFDASYPLDRVTNGWLNIYAYAQFFAGYGESLRTYNQTETRGMIGVALAR